MQYVALIRENGSFKRVSFHAENYAMAMRISRALKASTTRPL